MQLTFTPPRVAALVVLVAGFALAGGFVLPAGFEARSMRTWTLAVLLFLIGAVAATVVDHTTARANLRWFYLVVGVCGMAGAVTLRHGLGSP